MESDGGAPLIRAPLLEEIGRRQGLTALAETLGGINRIAPGLARFQAVFDGFAALADQAPDLCGRAIAGVAASDEPAGAKARLSLAALAGARHHRAVVAVTLKLFAEGLAGRDAAVFAAEALLQAGAFCPPEARSGALARPYLAVIAAAADGGFDDLAASLSIVLRQRVRPIRAGGPVWRRMRRTSLAGLRSRHALHCVGGALSRQGFEGPHARARVQFARRYPYLPDGRPGPFARRLLVLNRYPMLSDPDIRFVYNSANFPHAYASAGVPEDLALDVLLIGALDFDAVIGAVDPPDAVYNNLASPEAMAAEGDGGMVRRIADHFGARLINPPERVVETARDANWRRIGEREHAFFPKTLRFPPGFDPGAARAEVEAGFSWPVIIRDPIRHMGADMTLAETPEAAAGALAALTASGAYVIQFHDFAGPDGLYAKHRAFKIGDEVAYARLHCGEGWNVHVADHDRLDAARPELALEARRRRLRDDPLSEIPGPVWDEICGLLREAGLDMVGADFGMTPDGRALIFEMNPAMRTPDFGREAFADLIGLGNSG